MEVDWVVFDAVGTVIRPEPSIAVAYHAIGKQFGSDRTVEDVSSRFSVAFAETEDRDLASESALTTSAAVEEARWRHIVSAVFPEVTDSEGCFQALHDHFARPSAWNLIADTEPALIMLRERRFHLAIASNFDHRLHPVCDGIQALTIFEKRFISSELGYRKPSKYFYRELLSDLNVAPERVLMVGDSLENDIQGALAVGMNAVLISRSKEDALISEAGSDDGSERPYRTISSLAELEGLLS